ncbi:MAG: flagellar export protein FliJ [Thermodesulfobacteriota bacterium]
MKTFKLHALLDYRKKQADRAHEKLAQSMEKRSSIAEAKKREENEMLLLRREIEDAEIRGVEVSELILHQEFISAKERVVRDLEESLSMAEADVREKKGELVEARQKKRALEILKQKRQEAREKKEKHAENVFLDEVAVIGFGGGR